MLRILIAVLVLTCTTQVAAAANTCALPANANQMASEIAAGVNAQRRANGLAPLAYSADLGRAATVHACDMAVNNFFGHRGSNGSTTQARVQAVGYRSCTVAENLAWGYPAAGQIIGGWMASSGHRANMLHPRVTEMGIGVTNGAKGPNWVLVLGRRC